jgi:hypothetical protein
VSLELHKVASTHQSEQETTDHISNDLGPSSIFTYSLSCFKQRRNSEAFVKVPSDLLSTDLQKENLKWIQISVLLNIPKFKYTTKVYLRH